MRWRRNLGRRLFCRFLFGWWCRASLQGAGCYAGLLDRVGIGVGVAIGVGALLGDDIAVVRIIPCCLAGGRNVARSFAAGGGRPFVPAALRCGLLLCRCACAIVTGIGGGGGGCGGGAAPGVGRWVGCVRSLRSSVV